MNRQLDEDLRSAIGTLYGVRLTTLVATLAKQEKAPIDSDMKAFWSTLHAVAADVMSDGDALRDAMRPGGG